MKTFNAAIVAFGLVVSTVAQSSSDEGVTATPTGPVIQVTYPGGLDSQTLVGSVVAIQDQITTVVVTCPEGTDGNDCGFYPPITLTAGPTTLRFALTELESAPPLTQECSFNSEGGVCTVTGDAGSLDETGSGVVTVTTTFDASDIQAAPITITAGDTAGLNGASTTSSMNAGTGGSGSNNNGASSTTTTSNNDARILAPGGFGAALLGLAAIYL